MLVLSIGFILVPKSFYCSHQQECLAANARACQQKLACNLAIACALLIISENDEPHKQKSLAFALELG